MNRSVLTMGSKRKARSTNPHHLGHKISQLRDVIKRKYRNFKQGNLDTEILLEKSYKPLISELRKNVGKNDASLSSVKKEEPPSEDDMEDELNTRRADNPPNQRLFLPEVFSSPYPTSSAVKRDIIEDPKEDVFENSVDEDEDDQDVTSVLASEQGMESASEYIASNFANPITKRYMNKLMKDMGGKSQKIDHIYGPRYEGSTLMVGDRPLQFDEDGSIRVGDVAYRATTGLYELLFKRIPDDEIYDEHDLIVYKDILQKANAHKRGYKPRGNINRGNSTKYKMVISKLFPKSLYGGSGRVKNKARPLMKSLTESKDIVYWDNANELCERLRLLVVSAETGNNSHTNEIINIIEELREAKVISGRGNSKFLSLLQ